MRMGGRRGVGVGGGGAMQTMREKGNMSDRRPVPLSRFRGPRGRDHQHAKQGQTAYATAFIVIVT
jgi:hypothetical protein